MNELINKHNSLCLYCYKYLLCTKDKIALVAVWIRVIIIIEFPAMYQEKGTSIASHPHSFNSNKIDFVVHTSIGGIFIHKWLSDENTNSNK